MPGKKFTKEDLNRAAVALEINPNHFPTLLEGMNVEQEHNDIGEGDPVFAARIALAHIREKPDYYARLKKAGL
jgi:hypothetical protein